jgi:FAD/FMN-containing dehydrogenase
MAGGLTLGAGAGTLIALAATSRRGSGGPSSPASTPSTGGVPGSGGGTTGAARTPAATHTVSAQPADWTVLRGQLSTGRLVRPESPGYYPARLQFDPRFDDARPSGIAYCAIPADVSACLAFARRFGVPIAVRSGGHSYGGWSTTSGLVIDVGPMSRVSVDAASGTARVGAGTLLIDLYDKLAAHGRAVPGGSCPTVGVAGLALGGGVGVVGRLYGLTCDNVLAVQIVTADGVVRECSETSNPDLFWACRGGGGGSFGVVTEFTLRTHPAPDLVLFFLQWPWSQAGSVVSAWQAWAPAAPDELWSNLHLSAAPGGAEPQVSVGGTYAGGIGEAQGLLDRLYAAVGSAPSSTFMQSEPYLTVMLVEAGCATLSVAQCHLPWQNPAGALGRVPELATSDFYTARLPPAGIGALLGHVEQMGLVSGAPGAAGGVAFDAFGGAINGVSPAATAFVHRDALFLAQYTTTWTAQSPGGQLSEGRAGHGGPGDAAGAMSADVRRQRAWLASFRAVMRPYASGQAYQNYADPDLADWQRAYYGANYPRLQRIKAAVDPADLFHFPQSIELPGKG